MAQEEWLVGTWRLVSYKIVGSRGRIRYPYGDDATGYILYGADGYMAVSIMSANRQALSGVDILRRTTEEAAAATRTYLSYSGTYEVHPDRVIHHIKASLFPKWTGTSQERFYCLDGDCLTLSTAPLDVRADTPRAFLIWERIREHHAPASEAL